MAEAGQKKLRIPVGAGSKIVGKTIGEVEEKFEVSILELDNTNDRAFLFSWEIKPGRSTTIKSDDEIVVLGKAHHVERFSRLAASLN
jgi:Trk K+ transport system NAD-binding subunit